MNLTQSGRRRFLKNTAAFAGLAAAGVRPASGQMANLNAPPSGERDLHEYGARSHYETSIRTGSLGGYETTPTGPRQRDFGFRTPLQNSAGIITPASLHFIVSHGYDPPDLDPRHHRLLIHGMVDRPLTFSVEDLLRLPSVSRLHFLECHGNSAPSGAPTAAARIAPNATVQDTHGLTSCSEWTGVPLSLLLDQVGVKKGATWIVAEGAEPGKHAKSIPIEKAADDVLVVYSQNGEALRPEQGYPLRLLVPGWQGINNVKWLRQIKLVDEPYMFMMETTKYPSVHPDGTSRWFEFELGAKSVITRPSGGQELPSRGFYEITGLAWSGAAAVRKVEVSTDGGKTWADAKLQEPIARKAHTRFTFPWTWKGEESVLQSRCTDETGQVQPTINVIAKSLNIEVDYIRKTSAMVGDFNAIQPWRVDRSGRIQNALL
jgi:sulfane dehydrogenase subunit SoxC